MLSALILAAGSSSRMGGGRPKQLLRYRGKTLLRRAVDTALEVPVEQVVVVVGDRGELMLPELEGTEATVVINDQWAEGLSTSLRGGLAAVAHGARGVFIYPADMPFITAEALRELARQQQMTGRPAAMAEVAGTRGVPVYVTRPIFPALMIQEGDSGGAQYLRNHPNLVEAVRFSDADLMRDIDQPDDYRALMESDPDLKYDARGEPIISW